MGSYTYLHLHDYIRNMNGENQQLTNSLNPTRTETIRNRIMNVQTVILSI